MSMAARMQIVMAAKSWIGTPFHHAARVKGPDGGVDCIQLIVAAYEEAGVVRGVQVPFYTPDFMMHSNMEQYMDGILGRGYEVKEPDVLPGDVVLFRFGQCFSHGGIVAEWPLIVHAFVKRKVNEDDVSRTAFLLRIAENVPDHGAPRQRKFFRYHDWR